MTLDRNLLLAISFAAFLISCGETGKTKLRISSPEDSKVTSKDGVGQKNAKSELNTSDQTDGLEDSIKNDGSEDTADSDGTEGPDKSGKPGDPTKLTLSFEGALSTIGTLGNAMKVKPTKLTGDLASCSVKKGAVNSSVFPGALSVDAKSCEISGTPSAALGSTTFVVEAIDTNGISVSASLTLEIEAKGGWTRVISVPSKYVTFTAVASDPARSSYITGTTNAGLSGPLTGSQDSVVAKYDVLGTQLWLAQFGTTGKDAKAKVVTTGVMGDSFFGGELNGGSLFDGFVVKVNKDGKVVWSKVIASSSVWGLAVDAAGNIYVSGDTRVALNGATKKGSFDYFLLKMNSTGDILWTKQEGGAGGATFGYNMTKAGDGSGLFLTGSTAVALNGSTLVGFTDYFIAKYDFDGGLIWSKQSGASSGYVQGVGVASDPKGAAYLAVRTRQALDGQTQTGYTDAAVVKYDANGTRLWTSQFGGAGSATKATNAGSIAVDDAGQAYICGSTNGSVHSPFVGPIQDRFTVAFDAAGKRRWAKQSAHSGLTGLAVDATNHLMSVSYGPTENGGVIWKYDTDGNQ